MSTAYEQGQAAFRKDGSRGAQNPFPFPDVAQSCDDREEWQMGFRDASPNPFRFPWNIYSGSVSSIEDADGKFVCEPSRLAIAMIIVGSANDAYASESSTAVNQLIRRLECERAAGRC